MARSRKYDSVLFGLIPGLILPVLTLLIIYLVRYEGGLKEFLSTFQRMHMLSKVVSLSAVPNLLLFFLFIWTNRIYSARGVIFATLVVAAVMLVLKFS
jgi:cell shape-determining protein MreD